MFLRKKKNGAHHLLKKQVRREGTIISPVTAGKDSAAIQRAFGLWKEATPQDYTCQFELHGTLRLGITIYTEPESGRMMCTAVEPGGAGAMNGLKVGDQLTTLNNRCIPLGFPDKMLANYVSNLPTPLALGSFRPRTIFEETERAAVATTRMTEMRNSKDKENSSPPASPLEDMDLLPSQIQETAPLSAVSLARSLETRSFDPFASPPPSPGKALLRQAFSPQSEADDGVTATTTGAVAGGSVASFDAFFSSPPRRCAPLQFSAAPVILSPTWNASQASHLWDEAISVDGSEPTTGQQPQPQQPLQALGSDDVTFTLIKDHLSPAALEKQAALDALAASIQAQRARGRGNMSSPELDVLLDGVVSDAIAGGASSSPSSPSSFCPASSGSLAGKGSFLSPPSPGRALFQRAVFGESKAADPFAFATSSLVDTPRRSRVTRNNPTITTKTATSGSTSWDTSGGGGTVFEDPRFSSPRKSAPVRFHTKTQAGKRA